jgi:hypothetical protein
MAEAPGTLPQVKVYLARDAESVVIPFVMRLVLTGVNWTAAAEPPLPPATVTPTLTCCPGAQLTLVDVSVIWSGGVSMYRSLPHATVAPSASARRARTPDLRDGERSSHRTKN